MSYAPIRIFCAGQEITTYADLHLERKKEDLTGLLSFALVYTGVPTQVIKREIASGAEITAYVGGQLAFWGTVDERKGKGDTRINRSGSGRARSIGRGDSTKGDAVTSRADANSYTITVRARGKTKRLIDSSHDHETSTMLGPTTRSAVEKLVKSWKTQVEWLAPDYQLDKLRFRDGATVKTELHRIANENGLFAYETRDGKLRYTAGPVGMGQPLIAGDGILAWLATQSEEGRNSKITVKGQRTKKGTWGKEAVHRKVSVAAPDVRDYAPIVIQHDGDGDDDSIKRRAKFEADAREQESSKVTVEVFHVQPKSGLAWDLGLAHYVQIPAEGIYDVMECVGIEYVVDHEKTLKTVLHLAAVPSGSLGGVAGGGLFGLAAGVLGGAGSALAGALGGAASILSSLGVSIPGGLVLPGGFDNLISMATQGRALANLPIVAGLFPGSWGGANLTDLGGLNDMGGGASAEVAELPDEPPDLDLGEF